MRYYEDLVEGSSETYGPRRISREEMIAFAAEFDPQPMHLDEAAARHTMLGGLAASGWHTAVLMMRLLVDGMLSKSSSMGAPGVDELRWLKPVRPDDELSVRITIVDKRVSKSRPDIGLVRLKLELFNQKNEMVIEESHTHMFGLRATHKA